jgi:hypothetical protein
MHSLIAKNIIMDDLILGSSIIFNVTLQVLVLHELLALVVSFMAKSHSAKRTHR